MLEHLKSFLLEGKRILKLSAKDIFLIIGILGIVVFLIRIPGKDSIKSLIIPGPLTETHAKYERDCWRCHDAFKKGNQNDLCLNCHKEIAEDLKGNQRLHGLSGAVKEKQCKSCHTDHEGRKFDITHLDRETFNHDLTGFLLVGGHARASITCEACHLQGKKYRDVKDDCLNCHAKNDIHKGQLGKDCASCHKEASWQDTFFDHKKTRFPLEGKHQKITCNACHIKETYKGAPVDCMACHLINDVHASAPDNRCSDCHNVEGWKNISYDHNQKTKFMLQGRHVEVKCDSCHLKNIFYKSKLSSACIDCHKADDTHKGKEGGKCELCHSVVNWKKIAFDHSKDTKYKLLGRHNGLACESCHRDNAGKMKIDAACYSCHNKEDTHKGQQGEKCELCHNENGWAEKLKFDHDLTDFPLIGLHAVTLCGECHITTAFKDADTACISCHQKDDYHKATLGTDCAKCHNPNGWKLWEFNHDTQTKYKLEGSHQGLECKACHQMIMGKDVLLSADCLSCHEDDDTHRGRFGQRCDRCHTVESFKKILWEDKSWNKEKQ